MKLLEKKLEQGLLCGRKFVIRKELKIQQCAGLMQITIKRWIE